MAKPTALAYIRRNVQMPGENFIQQYSKLTDADKKQLTAWAEAEMELLGVTE